MAIWVVDSLEAVGCPGLLNSQAAVATNSSAAKGGSVSSTLLGCPCRPSPTAVTPPPLPTFEPP